MVTSVNGLLDQIAALNGQIRSSTAVGDNPNTSIDQRNYDIDQLSQYISTQTSVQSDGRVLVSVNGQALVNDTVAYHLANPVVGTASNGIAELQRLLSRRIRRRSPSSASIPLGSGQLGGAARLVQQQAHELRHAARSVRVHRWQTKSIASRSRATIPTASPVRRCSSRSTRNLPISAGNIKAGITNASQLPIVLANTDANTSTTTGIVAMNSANNTVDTSQALIGNGALANPARRRHSPRARTLTINVDGVAQTFRIHSAAPPATGAVPGVDLRRQRARFRLELQLLQCGVTASFDSASQRIVFQRDPTQRESGSARPAGSRCRRRPRSRSPIANTMLRRRTRRSWVCSARAISTACRSERKQRLRRQRQRRGQFAHDAL